MNPKKYTHQCKKCKSKFTSEDNAIKHVSTYHPNHAGHKHTVRSKDNGGTGSVYNAEEAGYDTDGGKFVATCDVHDTLINVDTVGDAKFCAANTSNFCDDCRDAVYGNG